MCSSIKTFTARGCARRIRLACAAVTCATGMLIGLASPAGASTGTYYVDGSSLAGRCSDSYTVAQAQSTVTPWCTISKAVATVPAGATIQVAPSIYHEQVQLTPRDDGVTLAGVGASKPIVDGDNTREVGIILVNGVHGVTIEGFEVRDIASPSGRAAGIVSYDTYGDTIADNDIHDVHSGGLWSYGIVLGWNGTPGLVHDVVVSDNRIYDIGPGGESMGIWLLFAEHMTVQGNEIFLVRKEGIRDWGGLQNSFIGNRLYLNWCGITLESATGDLVEDNVSYFNVWGYDPKHVSDPTVLPRWGLSSGQWTMIWHNTSYGNTHADIALGMNLPSSDYLDVRDNVFASPGDVHVQDFPSVRGTHVTFDGNDYSGSAPIYYANWDTPHPTYATLAAVQSHLGWEAHGQLFTPQFTDPQAGEFDFTNPGLAAGVALPDLYGPQVGARTTGAASESWTRYPVTVIASSPIPSFVNRQNASDGRDDTNWFTTGPDNGWVTFDLGSPEPVNTFVLDLFSQCDPRNPKRYSIQVSANNVAYTTVLAGTNPDCEGSSYKYTLAAPVSARYVKLNLLSSFGGRALVFSDFAIGLLSPTGNAQPAPAAPKHVQDRSRDRSRRRRRRPATRRRSAGSAHRTVTATR
ncbi:MAG: discoidin domain-containing protein [Solirubrobacteraceae bacterium]